MRRERIAWFCVTFLLIGFAISIHEACYWRSQFDLAKVEGDRAAKFYQSESERYRAWWLEGEVRIRSVWSSTEPSWGRDFYLLVDWVNRQLLEQGMALQLSTERPSTIVSEFDSSWHDLIRFPTGRIRTFDASSVWEVYYALKMFSKIATDKGVGRIFTFRNLTDFEWWFYPQGISYGAVLFGTSSFIDDPAILGGVIAYTPFFIRGIHANVSEFWNRAIVLRGIYQMNLNICWICDSHDTDRITLVNHPPHSDLIGKVVDICGIYLENDTFLVLRIYKPLQTYLVDVPDP